VNNGETIGTYTYIYSSMMCFTFMDPHKSGVNRLQETWCSWSLTERLHSYFTS